MYSMFFQKRKSAVSFFMLKSTPRKNYTEVLVHLFLTLICICIEVTKTTQKITPHFWTAKKKKAKNKRYLLKCYTFRCFGNARKLYSYVIERQIFNLFWHKTSKLTIQKLSSLVFYADGLQHAFQLWDNLHLASQSEHNNIH